MTILLRAVAIQAAHPPRLVEVAGRRGRFRLEAPGVDRGDLGALGRNSNDLAAGGGVVPVRAAPAAPGHPPATVGSAANFRVIAGPDGGHLLLADLEVDPRHLGMIGEHPRVTIERGGGDDRRRQYVAGVTLNDGPPGVDSLPLPTGDG